MDETNKLLISEVVTPILMTSSQPRIYYYEYLRNGVADIFMMYEPLAARSYTVVTNTQTKIDFAQSLKDLSDKYYLHVEKK